MHGFPGFQAFLEPIQTCGLGIAPPRKLEAVYQQRRLLPQETGKAQRAFNRVNPRLKVQM